jgi:hypothetical protein
LDGSAVVLFGIPHVAALLCPPLFSFVHARPAMPSMIDERMMMSARRNDLRD